MKKSQPVVYFVTILLIYYISWYILSRILGGNILPDPFIVFLRGFQEIATRAFCLHTEASSFRLLAGLSIAFLLGRTGGFDFGQQSQPGSPFLPADISGLSGS
jgi:ABC-type nitrate/sulfonate/bicarbonate transport system permease component